jgi:bifunctional DNA-binding transcriptional regulator/antitoxin component of YhaV-PrlF toxin-antitoxin module
MKNTIIQRKLDELGRVVIPIEFLQELEIHKDENIRVYVSEPNEEGTFIIHADFKEPNTSIQAGLGRLILPASYRSAYDLTNSTLDIWTEDGKLRFRKTIPQCVITGDTENIVQYGDTGKYLSKRIIVELYHLLK